MRSSARQFLAQCLAGPADAPGRGAMAGTSTDVAMHVVWMACERSDTLGLSLSMRSIPCSRLRVTPQADRPAVEHSRPARARVCARWRLVDFASKERLRVELEPSIRGWNQWAYPFTWSRYSVAMVMTAAPVLVA
jgi:hypothetical protein